MRSRRRWELLAALVLAWLPGAALAQWRPAAEDEGAQVLLAMDEALREIFPEADGVAVREWRPTPSERHALEERLGRPLYEPAYAFILAYDGSRRLLGYALVTEERGKYRPITFMVGVTPDFEVRDAAVMVYRESRGGEVRRRRFLVQYRGKTLEDPIRINRDIINISGATISVRSMNAGIRKALAVAEAAFGGEAPAPPPELRPVTDLR